MLSDLYHHILIILSQSQKKFVRSLHQKKYRNENDSFIAEGHKISSELIKSDYKIHSIYCTKDYYEENKKTLQNFTNQLLIISKKDLQSISFLETNETILICAKIPKSEILENLKFNNELIIGVDGIQDPGNFGSLIRIADWFGIKKIVCSESTVDLYNPKVIQATMGSFCRVNVVYADLVSLLNKNNSMTVYGAVLDGTNIRTLELNRNGIVIFGNESHGISKEVMKYVTLPISIPRFGGAESLNVTTAAAIICDYFKK